MGSQVGPRTVTARDVALVAGVHPSTVSRSLDPIQMHQVSSSTQRRVQDAARALGYRPNLTASSLRRKQSMTIGVLISSFSNPIYGELLHGISSELEYLGYHVLIAEVPDEVRTKRMSTALEMLQSRSVDGLICAASRGEDAEILRAVEASGLPVVLSLRWIEGTGIPRVVNDDALGGALAAQHLWGLGHRRIVEITGPMDISTFSERARGFGSTLQENEGDISHVVIWAETPTVEEGYRVMSEHLTHTDSLDATAVFAHNDLLAVGAIDALADGGKTCPADVSVIGYNDNPLTGHLSPALTTIRLKIDAMGRQAAQTMVSLINGRTQEEPSLSIPPVLVVRESTAPLPG